VAKKKSKGSVGRKGKGGARRSHPDVELVVDENGVLDLDALHDSVGRGSLAEQILTSLETAIDELQRVHGEVAAVGKSLALSRAQLLEQEDELEELREAAGRESAAAR
jgi:hypothetical protein